MPKLIFDIETVGVEFESLDDKSKEFLLAYAESPEEIDDVKNGMGFSPLTGSIVAIGILNPDTEKGAVYFRTEGEKMDIVEEDGVHYVPCLNEKEILKKFWDLATHYDLFVSFNGHSFDVPFIMIRSAILKIKPTINLMHNRYAKQPHFDLLDVLSNFGAARWRKNLHMWCQGFGIESPKAEGVSVDDVAGLFKSKEYLKIAKYCYGDIVATGKLYEHWNKYINVR
ncbi:MAG TPA: hypothetical protein DEB13_01010 [Candidatus Yanofskybacteria bacterium]|nr:hypothetical protein [Candidatus Yanofskybacteria bacterium]